MTSLESELVSAFMDGELSAPMKAKVEENLKTSAAWRRELQRLSGVRELLRADPEPEVESARDRVWTRITAEREDRASRPVPFWRRMIAVPVPVFAGAVCLTLVLCFALVLSVTRGSVGWMQITTAPSGVKQVTVQAPIQELEALLRSLDADAPSREMIIELPAESQFSIGEPVLVRGQDRMRGVFQ